MSFSIPCVSQSGQFVFDLMDTYGGGQAVLFVAIFETVVLMWVFGFRRFSSDLRFMLRTKTSVVWQVCWLFIPVILTLIFIAACVGWSAPTYPVGGEVYHYSAWANGIGWFLTILVCTNYDNRRNKKKIAPIWSS